MATIERDEFKAEKQFTDRVEPRRAFWSKYDCLVGKNSFQKMDYEIIQFYGIGGIGKTRLIDELCRELRERGIDQARIDFDKFVSNDKLQILRQLALQLFEIDPKRFKFASFRAALVIYQDLTGFATKIDESHDTFLDREEVGLVLDVFKLVPLLSTAVDLTEKANDFVRYFKGRASQKELEEEGVTPEDLMRNLDHYFYEDLDEAMESSDRPLVIFLDTYEKFANTFMSAAESSIYTNERWLTAVIKHVPHVLWVVGGRDKVGWDASMEVESHLLGDLSEVDATSFLHGAGVPDSLVPGICQLTGGTPLFLDICVDTFVDMRNLGRTPAIADFGTNTGELVERYLKYMDKDLRELAYALACLGSWTDEMVRQIRGKSQCMHFSDADYQAFLGHSFIVKDQGERRYMHSVVQSTIYGIAQTENPELVSETSQLKSAYEIGRLSRDDIDNIESLTAAVNELVKGSPSQADAVTRMEDLRTFFERLLDAGQLDQPHILCVRIGEWAFAKDGSASDALKHAATELIRTSYEHRRSMLKGDDWKIIQARHDLAWAYLMTGRTSDAATLREENRSAIIAAHGERDGWEQVSGFNRGAVYNEHSGDCHRVFYYSGNSYEGNMPNGTSEGQGTFRWPDGSYYVGEFVNGVREGRGVNHYSNGNIYEGEWVNDCRSGHGTYTWPDGRTYDGEWMNGCRSGHGTYTWPDGRIYDGEWIDDKECGHATVFYEDGSVYEGNFADNVREGHGVFKYPNGNVFEGNFSGGKKNGHGIMIWKAGHKYDGEWTEGTLTGRGAFTWADGDVYDGEFEDYLYSGHGTLRYHNGNVYDGEWDHSQKSGHGTMRYQDGNTYEGEWVDDERSGHGVFTWASGSVYDGEWAHNEMCGRGTMRYQDGRVYEGEWAHNTRNGHGHQAWPEGITYDGAWTNGMMNGLGTMTWPSEIVYSGIWVDGHRKGHGTMTWSDGNFFEGEWADDKRCGHGTLLCRNGERYEGEWMDGKKCGHGIQKWADGRIYEGEFANDAPHGHGILTTANGAVSEGDW